MIRTMARHAKHASTHLDFNDRFFFAGLAIACAGGAMLSVPWTLVVIGAVLAALGLFGR